MPRYPRTLATNGAHWTKGVVNKRRILIVDDEPDLLRLLEDSIGLYCAECEIVCASDGYAALAQLERQPFDLVLATRDPGNNGLSDLRPFISFGASPRAGINLVLAARAHAFINGRGFVTPDDIKEIAPDVLRHRVIVSYEAEAESVSSADIVQRILDHAEVP